VPVKKTLPTLGLAAAVMLAPTIASPPSAAAANPPRLQAAVRAPEALPTALAKRKAPRRARRNGRRAVARAASTASWNFYQPSVCQNTWVDITQPYMWGHGSDYNWVAVQHGLFKYENGVWRAKSWGQPWYARALDTRTSPTMAWKYQNGTPAPNRVYQTADFGYGQYRIAHYLVWYDAYNRVAATASAWAKHYNFGVIGDYCDLNSYGGIS
jgi:hypothetical protein